MQWICVCSLVYVHGVCNVNNQWSSIQYLNTVKLYYSDEAFFNADTLNQLEQHSGGDKSTYAYYFTELLPSAQAFWKVPDWLKVAADHCDELEFLFGGVYYKEENNSLWNCEYFSCNKLGG